MQISSLHKTATTLQQRIYLYINDITKKNVIEFYRINSKQPRDYEWLNKLIHADVIVLRHPINRMISMYYSYGWTHTTVNFTEEEKQMRAEMRSKTMSDWVISDRMFVTRTIYNRIFDLYDVRNAIQNNEEKPRLVKYEDMMDNPRKFISLILHKIDEDVLIDCVYEKFKQEFIFNGKDKSYDIVNNGDMSHIRNLDHQEYLNKFNQKELERINDKMYNCIETYNNIEKL